MKYEVSSSTSCTTVLLVISDYWRSLTVPFNHTTGNSTDVTRKTRANSDASSQDSCFLNTSRSPTISTRNHPKTHVQRNIVSMVTKVTCPRSIKYINYTLLSRAVDE
jgi:hypothetical protein